MRIEAPWLERVDLKTRLPKSAKGFVLVHRELGKKRRIKPFIEQLYQRIPSVVTTERDREPFLQEALALYSSVTSQDIPLYRKSIKNLRRICQKIGPGRVLYYGRDAEYLAYAVAASEFGREKTIGRPVVLNISSDIAGRLNDKTQLEGFRRLFEQVGIDENWIHVDVGKYGSAPRRVINALWPHLNKEEVRSRIKLVDPQHKSRRLWKILEAGEHVTDEYLMKALLEPGPIEGIGKPNWFQEHWMGMGFGVIESRPHTTQKGEGLGADKTGERVYVVSPPNRSREQLLAWVVRQAVVREFLPKARIPWL